MLTAKIDRCGIVCSNYAVTSKFPGSPGRLRSVMMLLTASVILYGCGGSGTSGSSAVGGNATLAQRAVTMTAIASMFNSLPHQDVNADNQAMLQFLQHRPEFEAAGSAAPGSVWARYHNGEIFLFINDDMVATSDVTAAKAAHATGLNLSKRSTADAVQLPAGANVMLFDNIGVFGTIPAPANFPNPYVRALVESSLSTINSEIVPDRYSVKSQDGTPMALKSVKNADLLYIYCHGGPGVDRSNKPIFIINTSLPVFSGFSLVPPIVAPTPTPIDIANAAALQADITAGRVGMLMLVERVAGQKLPAGGILVPKPYYYITPSFVTQYMSFDANSLVIINGCAVTSSMGAAFQSAFAGKGASAFAGWDGEANSEDALDTGEELLTGVLGTPKQRAFAWPAVLHTMSQNNHPGRSYAMTLSYDSANPATSGDPATPTGKGGFAHFSIVASGDLFGELSPSIENMSVDETKEQLTINGLFGQDPGQSDRQVTVGGTALDPAKIQWTPNQLICQLPHLSPGIAEPAGSAGDVIVTVLDHQSNTVRLTEWRGTFNYTQTAYAYPPDPLPPGILPTEPIGNPMGSYAFAVTLHFRADVHNYRSEPNQTPQEPAPVSFTPAQDSTAVLTSVSGNFTNIYKITDMFQKNPASGFSFMPPLVITSGSSSGWSGSGSINVMAKTVTFSGKGILVNAIQDTVTYDPNLYPNTPTVITLEPALFTIRGAGSSSLSLSMDSNFNISGGSQTLANNPYLDMITLQWSSIPAMSPPDPTAAQ